MNALTELTQDLSLVHVPLLVIVAIFFGVVVVNGINLAGKVIDMPPKPW